MMTMTDQQLADFERDGLATVDSPFTTAQINAASEAFDRLLSPPPYPSSQPLKYRTGTSDFTDPALIDLVQHPFLEEVAKQVLRCDQVKMFRPPSLKQTYPDPNRPFEFSLHTDARLSSSDLRATPRRMPCNLLIWISDVTPQTAPLMVRPGSHRQIAEAIGSHPAYLPLMNNKTGQPTQIEDYVNIKNAHSAPTVVGWFEDQLPDLKYHDPVPLTARAGQVTVWTQAVVHGASTNTSNISRKVIFNDFQPQSVEIGVTRDTSGKRRRHLSRLASLMRPERCHLIEL